MHLLILGYSSIVRRRVLPAARAVRAISEVSIASRRHGPAKAGHYVHRDNGPQDGSDGATAWYEDYDKALAESGADVAYVSGVNSAHAAWATRALERGLHVIVDKPAFPDAESAERIAALARQRRRALAEATVFAFHPQVAAIQSLMKDADPASVRATMTFSVPPLPADDFRYRADCGGGSLYDLGPYVVATNRLLFGSPPAGVCCTVLSTTGSPEVDTSFSVLLTHASGGALAGHCGFVTSYQNRLSVLTRSSAIDAERIFTTPADFSPTLRSTAADGARSIAVPAADAFALFLQAFCEGIQRHELDGFESSLLADARLLGRLRDAAGGRA